jgi:hypothetical protein
MMKILTIAAALTALIAAAPVFAADAQPATDTVAQNTSLSTTAPAPGVQVAASAGKTRAEVYQELLQAEKSGEMQRLNSTLYAN